MRVVLDTKVLVSALVFPGGSGERALLRVVDGIDRLVISPALVDELLAVLARKFARDREQLARVAVFLDELAERVDPSTQLRVLADVDDDRVLECAVDGAAELIVTGDRQLLALSEFRGVQIVSLREYLSLTPRG